MKWFCSLCWRKGELLAYSDDALAEAKGEHSRDVKRDMKAQKIPAGMDPKYTNSPMMDRIEAVYCPGDVHLGDMPATKKPRFDSGAMPSFDFDE